MNKRRHKLLGVGLGVLFLGLIVMLLGRTENKAYHPNPGTAGNCLAATAATDACRSSYYQEYEEFDLAFAEFTERGNAFDDRAIGGVLDRIRTIAQEPGVVLVTFIHGWKHNSNESDQNLIDFKNSLGVISRSLTDLRDGTALVDRRVVGVYVGWRGASLDVPVLKNVTFWDRKAVAEEVGRGGVTRLLLELDRIDAERPGNVFVVVGHSYGGAIVVSALTEVLTERVTHRGEWNDGAQTIGDAVIVLNPAIEANQALNLVEAALAQERFPNTQEPLFVSISSDADFATHYLFPIGQTLGLLMTWQQEDLKRASFPAPLKEEHLDATTVGNFAPFLTHWLMVSDGAGAPEFRFEKCQDGVDECAPKGLTSLSDPPRADAIPDRYPLFFIKTDESVMDGHNDIFNARIRAFVQMFIDDVIRRNLDPSRAKQPSLLHTPERVPKAAAEFFST